MRKRWLVPLVVIVLAAGAVVVGSSRVGGKARDQVWGDLEVAALRAAAAYDIYGGDVVVEYTYSRWRRPTVIVRPELPGENTGHRKRESRSARARRWEVKAVLVRVGGRLLPKTTVRNARRLAASEQEKVALGKAVVVAAKRLGPPKVAKGPVLSIGASPMDEGYRVTFTDLPAVAGGPSVVVSRSLKPVRIVPGR